MDIASSRRRVLRGAGLALVAGLAGCPSGEGSETGTRTLSPGTSNTTDSPEPGTERPPAADQPAVAWAEPVDSPTTRPALDVETVAVGTEAGGVYALAAADGHQEWSVALDESILAQPVIADDAVLVVTGETALGSNHEVVALDLASGQERWRFAPEDWWLDVVGVTEGRAYVATSDDALAGQGETLYALALDGGERLWSREIGDGGRGLVAQGTVYVPSAGRLYAYDAVDGTRRWSRPLPDYFSKTIAATAETVCYVGDVDDNRGTLVGLDATTGDRTWTLDDWVVTSTTLADGTLYTGGERVAALDPASGERRWDREERGFVPRVPVREGMVYAGGDGVSAYATTDGTREWTWTPEPSVAGAIPAAASAGTLFVDTFRDADPRNRYKFAIDARSGEQRWVFDGGRQLTSLAVAGDRVVVGGDAGVVYALDAA